MYMDMYVYGYVYVYVYGCVYVYEYECVYVYVYVYVYVSEVVLRGFSVVEGVPRVTWVAGGGPGPARAQIKVSLGRPRQPWEVLVRWF